MMENAEIIDLMNESKFVKAQLGKGEDDARTMELIFKDKDGHGFKVYHCGDMDAALFVITHTEHLMDKERGEIVKDMQKRFGPWNKRTEEQHKEYYAERSLRLGHIEGKYGQKFKEI